MEKATKKRKPGGRKDRSVFLIEPLLSMFPIGSVSIRMRETLEELSSTQFIKVMIIFLSILRNTTIPIQ
jgi:hypothetical protein